MKHLIKLPRTDSKLLVSESAAKRQYWVEQRIPPHRDAAQMPNVRSAALVIRRYVDRDRNLESGPRCTPYMTMNLGMGDDQVDSI